MPDDFRELSGADLAELQPGIGHNRPPDPIAALREDLADRSRDLRQRQGELIAAVVRVPAAIADEQTCGRVADFVKQITACAKALEAQRVDQKEPHLAAERAVDGFYKALIGPLDAAKKAIEARITAYQRAKAEEERRRREAEARRQAEEAERARREAEEAAAKAQTESELDRAIDVETTARQAAADAAAADKMAEAKAAELSRVRGDYGAVSSLRTFHDFRDLDRDKIDLDVLRPYLALDAIEKAVRAFVRAGGRNLAGVTIYENTAAVVR